MTVKMKEKNLCVELKQSTAEPDFGSARMQDV